MKSIELFAKDGLEKEIANHYKQCTLAVQKERWDLAKKHAELAAEKRSKLNKLLRQDNK